MKVEIGKTYICNYPFVKMPIDDNHGVLWRPGTDIEYVPFNEGPDSHFCTGQGKMILKVVSLHSPGGRYHQRVFHTRRWEAPDGTMFGTNGLRVATVGRFETLASGYDFDYDWDPTYIGEIRKPLDTTD